MKCTKTSSGRCAAKSAVKSERYRRCIRWANWRRGQCATGNGGYRVRWRACHTWQPTSTPSKKVGRALLKSCSPCAASASWWRPSTTTCRTGGSWVSALETWPGTTPHSVSTVNGCSKRGCPVRSSSTSSAHPDEAAAQRRALRRGRHTHQCPDFAKELSAQGRLHSPPTPQRNPEGKFKGQTRYNDTPKSMTATDVRLYRNTRGDKSRL